VVFDDVIAALVHGSSYERLASPGCSDRTIRRRLVDLAEAGHGQTLLRLALRAYDLWGSKSAQTARTCDDVPPADAA
jgi:hypothetical protein